MDHPSKQALALSIAVSVVLFPPPAFAANELDRQREALNLIGETADRICQTVSSQGSASSTNVQGQVNAQVNGLARKLANIGVTAGAQHSSSSWSGVLAKDLPTALRDSLQCRLQVFNSLKGTLLQPVASGRTQQPTKPTKTPSSPPSQSRPKTQVVRVPVEAEFDARKYKIGTGAVYFDKNITREVCASRLHDSIARNGSSATMSASGLEWSKKAYYLNIICRQGFAIVTAFSTDDDYNQSLYDFAVKYIGGTVGTVTDS